MATETLPDEQIAYLERQILEFVGPEIEGRHLFVALSAMCNAIIAIALVSDRKSAPVFLAGCSNALISAAVSATQANALDVWRPEGVPC
jgi:hypothetical protein